MMMNDMINTIMASAGIVFLMMLSSIYYWFRGRNNGIMETVAIFSEYEPEAVKRLDKVLKDKLDAELSE